MKRILLAYDGGEPARRALEATADLASNFGAEVGVVSVVPVHPGRAPLDPWDDATVHARELQEAKQALAARGIAAELLEPSGDPAKTIERIAEEGEYDTIVIGSRGLNAVGRLLQGSVSEHVVTHTAATVVVTH